jgi:Uma2 family endonuclease
MAALPQLITVEEFRRLPEGELEYELHFGEVVGMTRPRQRHLNLQLRLSRLLEPRLRSFGEVGTEIPYRPVSEFDLRVAAVSFARWNAIDPDDNLRGTPELVIEVKSPSNTERQLRQLVSMCLNRDTLEFWIVDVERKTITVFHRDGIPLVFNAGDTLSLAAFGAGELPVDEIFA